LYIEEVSINARDFAATAHGEQKYGTAPYVVHLDEVARIVSSVDPHEDAAAVAYLHDVLEDTSVTAETVEGNFGTFVRLCVEIVTDPPGATRKERKALLHERLKAVPESHYLALIVKAADRLANVRSSARDNPGLLSMYRKEHAAFKDAAFRPGLCDELWAEMERHLHQPQI
jgi:(p)ppGpp synthase/HD superfamily hydrolase